jgi:hypothetical protein
LNFALKWGKANHTGTATIPTISTQNNNMLIIAAIFMHSHTIDVAMMKPTIVLTMNISTVLVDGVFIYKVLWRFMAYNYPPTPYL